jgi:hypothetical protein
MIKEITCKVIYCDKCKNQASSELYGFSTCDCVEPLYFDISNTLDRYAERCKKN